MKTILIIDYDQASLAALKATLSREGFNVVTAGDGQVGWEMFKSEEPDLVLMEAMLSKIHGFELCDRITKDPARKVPVFIMTGVYKDRVYRTEALRTYGASEYFEKPLDMLKFIASIHAVLTVPDIKPEPEIVRPAEVKPGNGEPADEPLPVPVVRPVKEEHRRGEPLPGARRPREEYPRRRPAPDTRPASEEGLGFETVLQAKTGREEQRRTEAVPESGTAKETHPKVKIPPEPKPVADNEIRLETLLNLVPEKEDHGRAETAKVEVPDFTIPKVSEKKPHEHAKKDPGTEDIDLLLKTTLADFGLETEKKKTVKAAPAFRPPTAPVIEKPAAPASVAPAPAPQKPRPVPPPIRPPVPPPVRPPVPPAAPPPAHEEQPKPVAPPAMPAAVAEKPAPPQPKPEPPPPPPYQPPPKPKLAPQPVSPAAAAPAPTPKEEPHYAPWREPIREPIREPRPEPKPEPRQAPRVEPRPEPKPEPKPHPVEKVEQKAQARPEKQAEAKIFKDIYEVDKKKSPATFIAVGAGLVIVAAVGYFLLRPKHPASPAGAEQVNPTTMMQSSVMEKSPDTNLPPLPEEKLRAVNPKPKAPAVNQNRQAEALPTADEAIIQLQTSDASRLAIQAPADKKSVTKPAETKALDMKQTEAKTSEAKAGETKAAENQVSQAQGQPPVKTESVPPQASQGAADAGSQPAPAQKANAGDLVDLAAVDDQPKVLKSVEPSYPTQAGLFGKEGSVTVNALINESGNVIKTGILKGLKDDMGLEKAAEAAVRKWKFQPAKKDGVNVKVWKPIVITFKALRSKTT